ncbi:MAG: histidine phosphatase family protein [Bacteroidales bacterium]|jgi:phosphohistidine phosphatase|nr:histidine phosphatase family protein [Bacteroidales bacterium]
MEGKILHIVRHGKALQDYREISDIDRPLVEKGILNNLIVAKRLKNRCSIPDLIISSPAARALHTALIFARILKYPSERVKINDSLYMQGEDAALDILYELPDDIKDVMLVAHNPDMSYLASMFTRPVIESLPTSGIVSVCFDTHQWNKIHSAVKNYETDRP